MAPAQVGFMELGLSRLVQEAALVPIWEYIVLSILLLAIFLYHILDFHFLGDLVTGLRGDFVQVYYGSSSSLAAELLPNCEVLKKRYWPTPWLCSPHLQTSFLHFFGRPPKVEYSRQLYVMPDGGTIALDWSTQQAAALSEDATTVIVVPGLTSDSADPYVKHLVHSACLQGWRVVVANHRGLGGVSITSDCFYNAGWTDDLRMIVTYLRQQYPNARLLAVGTSIGANILVKYLGEEGENTPLGGAVAICCPWDLVLCDRFIRRNGVQTIYDKILTTGLRQYAEQHQNALSRMTDWKMIRKSRSIRDFDNYCTRLVSNFETVDTYYRRCSSVYYLGTVKVPLLCVSSLDDPVCTKEAIPWDECRSNPNVVLAVTNHGGHLAFFEGLTAKSIWWVPAATEFLTILHESSFMHIQRKVRNSERISLLNTEVDKGPYLNMSSDGKVAADSLYEGADEEGSEKTEIKGPSFSMQNSGVIFSSSLADAPITSDDSEHQSSEASKIINEDINCENNINHTLEISGTSSTKLVFEVLFKSQLEVLALCSALSQLMTQLKGFASDTVANIDVNPQMSPSSANASDCFQRQVPECPDLAKDADSRKELAINRHSVHLKGKDVICKEADSTAGIKKTETRSMQKRHVFWHFAYMAVVATCPFVGSIILLLYRGKLQDSLRQRLKKFRG